MPAGRWSAGGGDGGPGDAARWPPAPVGPLICGQFCLDPELLVVTVKSGIVTITGPVQRRADALGLLGEIRHVAGVVGVRDRLSYRPAG